jgi:hypothetical protein
VHVIVNPGGINERFDRAHLQKATIIQWSDNVTIFDALVERKADLMIPDELKLRCQVKGSFVAASSWTRSMPMYSFGAVDRDGQSGHSPRDRRDVRDGGSPQGGRSKRPFNPVST